MPLQTKHSFTPLTLALPVKLAFADHILQQDTTNVGEEVAVACGNTFPRDEVKLPL